jgi:hypothetical protein
MTLVNPFRQWLCPFCFERLSLADCEIVSTVRTGRVLHAKPAGVRRLWRRVWVQSLTGPAYTKELAARACPHCSNYLPDSIEYMDNWIVGMVGGTFSGKSHYVAALIKQIELEGALSDVGCIRFSPMNDDTRERYRRDFYEPLFIQKRILPPNPPTPAGELIKPLVYVMVFERKNARPRIRRVNLILFDTGGEDMSDEVKIAQISRYIINAHGLIFLVDPMSVPGIVEHLPFHLRPKNPPPESFRNLDPVINILSRQLGVMPGNPLPVPIAITMAKSDLLRYLLQGPDTDPVFLQRPDYSQGYAAQDAEMVDAEVTEIIRRYQGANLLNNKNAFTKAKFCAASATGMAADDRGVFLDVHPLRCVDPLRYILSELGVIENSNNR